MKKRKRPGPKPLPARLRSVKVSITMDRETHAKLKEMATTHGSVSSAVRNAIWSYE